VNRKILIIGIVPVFVLAAIFIASTHNSLQDFESKGTKFKEFVLKKDVFKILVSANGSIIPIDRVEIKSKASGLIEELPVEQGDIIKKGDLIARLDQKDERAAVDQAQADYDIAQAELVQANREYARRNKLYAQQLISEEERDQMELALAVAKGKVIQATITLDRAKERFSESIVRAPIDGIILQKYVEKDQIIASGISNVSGGTPIVDIADMSTVYIQAGVDEVDIGKIKPGQSAIVLADAYPQKPFQGRIIRIAPEAKIEQNVTLFNVIVQVDNKEGLLKSGMNTSIEITIVEEADVLLIPKVALLSSAEENSNKNNAAVLVKNGGHFQKQDIKIGMENFKDAIVLSGLQEGDILGVPMNSRLKEENEQREDRFRSSRSFGTGNRSN
jgi:HlyD family secretion protein